MQTKRRHAIDWRLIDNLYRAYLAFGRREVVVYSGFRGKAVARLKESYHTKGQAIDFRIAGVSRARLRDYLLKTFKKVGVGYYTNVPFVHMDVRPKRSAFWIDFSGSGEAPRYAHNAYGLLQKERRGVPIRERQRVFVVIAESLAKAGDRRKPTAGRKERVSSPTVAPIPPLPVLPGTPPAPKNNAPETADPGPTAVSTLPQARGAEQRPEPAASVSSSADRGVALRTESPRSGFGRPPR